jgi:hypothetical protein
MPAPNTRTSAFSSAIRHSVECYVLAPAAYREASYCIIVAQTGLAFRKSRLRGGQTLATWIAIAVDIAEMNSAPQRRT